MEDTGLNFIDFLAYGAIGIALALAILAYRLLSREQKNDQVREPMLRAIRNYFVLSIVLSLFFGTGEVISMFAGVDPQSSDEVIGELWDLHVLDHPEGEHAQISPKEKKRKMLELMKLGKDYDVSLNKDVIIDSLQKEVDAHGQLKGSFYVNFEKFRRGFNDLTSGNWIYLKSRSDKSELFTLMKQVFASMGKDAEEQTNAQLIAEWIALKKRWRILVPNKPDRSDHIERSDFTKLVQVYLKDSE